VFVRSDIPTWIAIALAVAVAAASWYLVEEPIQRWGSRLGRRNPHREPALPTVR
jgi:peptidoglycan/LPS O-acetylase OafA/YrhL